MKPKHVLLVALVTTAAGCAVDTPAGSAGSPDKYIVHPIDLVSLGRTVNSADDAFDPARAGQMQSQLLLDAREANSDVIGIALTSQHLYFAVSWEGIYRIPKHGGAVDVIDAGAMKHFGALTALGEEVIWAKMAFDNQDYPSVEIKRRADAGGPTTMLFSGPWGVPYSPGTHFQADPAGLFFVGNRAGVGAAHLHQLSLQGGAPSRVLRFENDWPSWRRDAGQIYFTVGSPLALREIDVHVLSDGQTEPGLLTTVVAGRAVIHDVDATSLYLSDSLTIWQIAKADGAVTELVKGTGMDSVIVDDKRVYFTAVAATGLPSLRSIGRADGVDTVLASGAEMAGVRQIEQDDSLLYLLHDQGHKVSVVAKPAGP